MSHEPIASASTFDQLVDLAAESVGGRALWASDDFFAGKENLLKPGRGVFIPGKYTENGKWMDGWESRRKRTPGHDVCLVKLGLPGTIRGVDIDTNHFTGNYPEHASIEVCEAPANASVEQLLSSEFAWREALPISKLAGGSRNLFEFDDTKRVTHLKLHIHPDGGVARLRVHGHVLPDWKLAATAEGFVDLGAITNGAAIAGTNDQYFGRGDQLIYPGDPANMGEGWETQRKRAPGNDWIVVRLASAGLIKKVEIHTTHFKGNFPDRCSLEGTVLPPGTPANYLGSRSIAWQALLPQTKLSADAKHHFDSELRAAGPFTHVRLSIYPDGGVARLRLFGTRSDG
jgi:allantoicase